MFKNPQSPKEMLTPAETQISTLYLQVKTGGDIAAMIGMMKHVLAKEAEKWAAQKLHVLDVDFIAQHTDGFDALKAQCRSDRLGRDRA